MTIGTTDDMLFLDGKDLDKLYPNFDPNTAPKVIAVDEEIPKDPATLSEIERLELEAEALAIDYFNSYPGNDCEEIVKVFKQYFSQMDDDNISQRMVGAAQLIIDVYRRGDPIQRDVEEQASINMMWLIGEMEQLAFEAVSVLRKTCKDPICPDLDEIRKLVYQKAGYWYDK